MRQRVHEQTVEDLRSGSRSIQEWKCRQESLRCLSHSQPILISSVQSGQGLVSTMPSEEDSGIGRVGRAGHRHRQSGKRRIVHDAAGSSSSTGVYLIAGDGQD